VTLGRDLRLVLIDDHKVFREALRALLVTYGGISIVGEADNARTGYTVVEQARPDVVVLDVILPGVDGVSATREILRRVPEARVLILSASTHIDRFREALAAGVLGYACKDQSADELVDAIRRVAAGERYFAPRLSLLATQAEQATPVGSSNGGNVAAGPDRETLEALSPREREIFDLIVRGFSNEGIARELSISIKTVETHRAHINKKLEVHSTADLVRFAARRGLLGD
jgi:DNA-binding NarL/FixJ family response regulator